MGAMVALDQISTQAMNGIVQPALALTPAAGAVDAYRSDTSHDFLDSIVGALLSTPALRRLAGIRFLGAIDYVRHGSGRAGHRRRHNRLEHSIGVAWLADIYAREAELPHNRRQLLLAAALLHDVGHGPLSHTLEPVFEAEFGINHHVMTRRLITGDVPFGQEIPEHLAAAGVDLDEVLALIEGEHDGDIGFLFSGQINLDRSRESTGAVHPSRGGLRWGAVRVWSAAGPTVEHQGLRAISTLSGVSSTMSTTSLLGAVGELSLMPSRRLTCIPN